MSIDLVAAALWVPLPPVRKLVLVALCEHARISDGLCWPSRKLIALRASIAERTVNAHLAALEAAGYLTTVEVANGHRTPRRAVNVDRILQESAASRDAYRREAKAEAEVGGMQNLHPRGAPSGTPGVHPAAPLGANLQSKRIEPPTVTGKDARSSETQTTAPPPPLPIGQRNPKVLQTPSGFQVDAQVLNRWKEAFPAVDIPGEVRRAFEWMTADSRRQKYRLQKFLVNWLTRAQDAQGARVSRNGGPPKGETMQERAARYDREDREADARNGRGVTP